MKMLALRPNTTDEDDAIFLIEKLGIRSADQVIELIEDFYPNKEVKHGTRLWLDEYFAK
jgi:hypothetical protein